MLSERSIRGRIDVRTVELLATLTLPWETPPRATTVYVLVSSVPVTTAVEPRNTFVRHPC